MGRLDIIKGTPYSINCDVLLKDFKWLVRQAELFEKFERNYDNFVFHSADVLKKEEAKVRQCEAENAKLREALAFYADDENYQDKEYQDIVEGDLVTRYSIAIEVDDGYKARKALEENSNG